MHRCPQVWYSQIPTVCAMATHLCTEDIPTVLEGMHAAESQTQPSWLPEASPIPRPSDSATSCRKQTRTGTKRRRPLPLPIATFLPVPIISALRRQIRTAPGPAHPQTWLSPYCQLSTRPPGSACCAWLRFWHSSGGCIDSECNNCGGRKENFAKPLRQFRRWRRSLDPMMPFNL
jgi:hypothetical protein